MKLKWNKLRVALILLNEVSTDKYNELLQTILPTTQIGKLLNSLGNLIYSLFIIKTGLNFTFLLVFHQSVTFTFVLHKEDFH